MKFLLNMLVVVACKSNDQMGCRRDRKGGRSHFLICPEFYKISYTKTYADTYEREQDVVDRKFMGTHVSD